MLDRPARLLLARLAGRAFYAWGREGLRAHQRRRLESMMGVLIRRSPYYRRLRADGWDGRFESLPHVSKREMIEHFDEINTAGLRQADLFEFAAAQERSGRQDLYRGRYSVGISSGTSGTRLPAVLSPWERWRYASLLFARSGIPARVRDPRVLFLLRINSTAFTAVRFLGVTMVYSDYTPQPEFLVDLINARGLNVLAGPPSMLRLLGRLRARMRPEIQAVVSYAEVLDDGTRAQLRRDFGVAPLEIYQATEGFIASTCRAGRLHLNEDVVYVEAFDAGDPQGKAKRIVTTDLYRVTLPFIRCSLNDVLELSEQPCPCGSCFRVVERVHGRADHVLFLRGVDGQVRYLFPDYVVRSINQASEHILEFQAIQHAPDDLEIRLELEPRADRPAIEADIRANLGRWAAKTGGELGRVRFSNELPRRHPTSQKLIRVMRAFEWK